MKLLSGAVALAFVATLFVLGGRAGWYGASKIVVEPLSASTPAGPIYFLPKAMIGLELSYSITKCDITRAPNSPEAVSLAVDVGARLVESVEPDLTRGYVIRADSVAGAFWRTDVV